MRRFVATTFVKVYITCTHTSDFLLCVCVCVVLFVVLTQIAIARNKRKTALARRRKLKREKKRRAKLLAGVNDQDHDKTTATIKDAGCVDNLVSGVSNGSIFNTLAKR